MSQSFVDLQFVCYLCSTGGLLLYLVVGFLSHAHSQQWGWANLWGMHDTIGNIGLQSLYPGTYYKALP
jgi:hypothetical protein